MNLAQSAAAENLAKLHKTRDRLTKEIAEAQAKLPALEAQILALEPLANPPAAEAAPAPTPAPTPATEPNHAPESQS